MKKSFFFIIDFLWVDGICKVPVVVVVGRGVGFSQKKIKKAFILCFKKHFNRSKR